MLFLKKVFKLLFVTYISTAFISVIYYLIITPKALNEAKQWDLTFQDPVTPVMEGIINLHHDIMYYLVFIVLFVLWMLLRTITMFNIEVPNRKNRPSRTIHHSNLEIVWTLIPTFILILIAIPSFSLLYSIDTPIEPQLTIKAIGHQWYWSYEYPDILVDSDSKECLAFDSYMLPTNDLLNSQLRLLEVDNKVVVPINTHVKVLAISADVLHCWAVPALGVKMDACPGRLNELSFYVLNKGIYYGQCSEICGINHGFMPIAVEAVDMDSFEEWCSSVDV